jgi:amino acid transporter
VDWLLFDLFQESAACFSGEVENPGRNYPKGMLYAVVLVFVSAFLPILIATGASDAPLSQWTDGFFVALAKDIVGAWLVLLIDWIDSLYL